MLWYSLEAPCRGASNEYHNICFCGEIRKILTWYPLLTRPLDKLQKPSDQPMEVHRDFSLNHSNSPLKIHFLRNLPNMGRAMRIPVFRHMQTVKAQISFRTVQSGLSLSTYRVTGYCRTQWSIAKFLIRLYISAGWSRSSLFTITKICLYNFDPLKPQFYIVKLGFTGVCIIFLISTQKHRLWVLVRTAWLRQF